jgi:trimethylamine--corrinoid protein Co-methyltransferase
MGQMCNGFNAPPLRYFTREQLRALHSAALDILEDYGTLIQHPEAVDMLKDAGAFLTASNRICLPTSLVEGALQTAPSRVTVYTRDGKPALYLEGTNVYFGTGSDCPHILDSQNSQRRPAQLEDVAEAARLADALPHIDFIMSMGLAADIDPEKQYQTKYAAMVRNATKPQVITAGNLKTLQDIVRIAAAAVGGDRDALIHKPIFVLYDEPTSPLVHTREAIDKLLYVAENRLPANYAPGMMAGGTGPVTMAGAIVQANAEILTGLTIHQLKQPGAPFVFGAGMSPLDMKSMQPTYAAPEAMITQAGLTQLGRELYHLPTWGFGGCSGSKLVDEQAVNEASSYIMMAGWMGTNLVHDVGYLEFGQTFSHDLVVICDEIIGQLRRMMEGISTHPEQMAVEVIKRVGAGGHFLTDQHTLDHFRENWLPGITDRNTFESWQNGGATTMGQRAKQKVNDILINHRPDPLPEEVNQAIDELLAGI